VRTLRALTLEEAQRENDLFRTTFKGGLVLMTPAVFELPAEVRGRALYRLTLYSAFDDDSLHDHGIFIFTGLTFVWRIEEFAGKRSLNLMLKEDL
jgi:hypothetical protein